MNWFIVPATMTRAHHTVDRGMSIGFNTQELSSEEKIKIADNLQSFGYLAFKPNQDWNDEELPTGDATFEGKTPSERLRAVIYVYYKQLSKQKAMPDFDAYYKSEIEGFINEYKGMLE